ncbi:integrase family protein [Rhodomicrobium vannielii ATCC 17100]|uniref:Integrase family protein n=1 Tax=Rhodomicrobium vannielii (strain ATCC 17100 / DSM 162 / LMG 4299 / NCIMB 10020 / ATH 3.1.1) TaxID=648757 RepID=E3I1H7_RHOVT|nr:integrase arm-type DNA-binding domain-containing protein [Rhodomicrobium vannielii]ADP71268.1 integrase family protein [Rhodomicrobium vannielii ATCC 17100]
MAIKLSSLSVTALKPKEKRYEVSDMETGLGVVVQPSGAKSFVVRYRLGKRLGKVTLGSASDITLAAAREQARQTMALVRQGIDPAEHRKTEKAARIAAEEERKDSLFEIVAEDYIRRHVSTLKGGHEVERLLRKHVIPAWKGRRIETITKRDILKVTDPIIEQGHGRTANHVFAWMRALFSWALERDLPGLEHSPFDKLKAPAPKSSRDRVLSEAELRLVLRGSQTLETPWREFVRLLVYTATRRNEVACAPWAEFTGLNTADPRWEIPGARTKNGRPLLLPLPLDAARMLAEMPRIGEKGLAFTVTGETPVMGFSDAKERLDAAMLAIARKEAAERGEDPEKVLPLPRWTWHDLRRTTATGMAGLGVQPHVIEAVLNHVSGAKAGVAGIYNRHAYLAEKKAALAIWAKHVATLNFFTEEKTA